MINTNEKLDIHTKYGDVKRSVLRNLFFSMLAFGLIVGLIFPPFARIILNTERAYSLIFISMCVGAGLLVGVFNFLIFRRIVSRELSLIQRGMNHVNKNIAPQQILTEGDFLFCPANLKPNVYRV